jgi:hypothetical protein
MKPIVAYYRVSTEKQARSGKKGLGLGLEAQREALERLALANGLQIIANCPAYASPGRAPRRRPGTVIGRGQRRSTQRRNDRASSSLITIYQHYSQPSYP